MTTAAVTLACLLAPAPRLHGQTSGEPYAALLPAAQITFPTTPIPTVIVFGRR